MNYTILQKALASSIEARFGPNVLEGYIWDPLPQQFPCEEDCILQHQVNRSKRDVTPLGSDPAVLYLPLGGGASKGCPSLAESSVVGISQMVFLWTVMSVFNVVANVVASINNNQNNRNNNNNNLNINKISTQNTAISANTNNANTITIMLPPPIPVLAGGRQLDAQQRLKRFVERERRIKKRQAQERMEQSNEADGHDHPSVSFKKVAMDILQHVVAQRGVWATGSQDCLGRDLCHLSRKSPPAAVGGQSSHLEKVALKIATTVLLWVQLDDTSQTYINFLDNVIADDFDETLDCDLLFYRCKFE